MNFTAIINIEGTDRAFHFTQLKKGPESGYVVYVKDGEGMPHAFVLSQDRMGHWSILPPQLPAWAKAAESQLSDAISEHTEGALVAPVKPPEAPHAACYALR